MDVLPPDIGIGYTFTCAGWGSASTPAEDTALVFLHAGGQRESSARRQRPLNKISNSVSTLAFTDPKSSSPGISTDELKIKCFALHSIYT